MSPCCAAFTSDSSSAEAYSRFCDIGLTRTFVRLFSGLQFPLRAGQKADNSRVSLAGEVHGFGKGFEHRLNHMMRLLAIEQFYMQVAAAFVGEALKKLSGQAE